MPARRIKHPFDVPRRKPLYYRLLNPGIIGGLTAAAMGALPRVPGRGLVPAGSLPERVEGLIGAVPGRVYMLLLGFLLGFSVSKGVGWVRLRALKALFSYQGWVLGASSTKTKVSLVSHSITVITNESDTWNLFTY